MKSLIPLGYGQFHVGGRPNFVATLFQQHRSTIALGILSEIASAVRSEGYEIDEPKRNKRENGMVQCRLGAGCGIDLVLSPRENTGDGLVFRLLGLGYIVNSHDKTVGENGVWKAWKKIQAISEQTTAKSSIITEISWVSQEQFVELEN